MNLYDYICLPNKYVIDQQLNKNELSYPLYTDEQNEMLLKSIDSIVLKYCIHKKAGQAVTDYKNSDDIFNIVEVSVNNHQYLFFAPALILNTIKSPTLLLLKYQDKYKLCINVSTQLGVNTEAIERKITPYFTGWIDTNDLLGRPQQLLERFNLGNMDLQDIKTVSSFCRDTVTEFKAIYVTHPKIEHVIKFILGKFKHGDKTKITTFLKDNCIEYIYQQRKSFKKSSYSRRYIFLYDLDNLFNELMNTEWIKTSLIKWNFTDGLAMLNRYQDYMEQYRYEMGNPDRSDFEYSDYLYTSSNWYEIDFVKDD